MVMNTAPEGIWVVDGDGRIVDVNPAICALTGYSQEELLQKHVSAVRADTTPGQTALQLTRIRERGFDRFEARLRRKDGSLVQVEASAGLFGPTDGRIVSFIRDNTQRKKAEQEASEREARLRAYFESPGVGIAITSLGKGWVEVNERVCSMLGYSREELARLTWLELTHPDDVAADLAEFDRLLRGEIDRYSLDKRFICKDGSTLWTLLSVSCVRRVEGSIDYFVAILKDIGQRKRAENDLRESEEQYRTLVESLHAGVVVHAPDTSIILTNATASELLGLSSEQMRGKVAIDPAWRFVRADGSTMPLQEYPINRVVATHRPEMNLTLGIDRPATKDRVWVLANAYPTFRPPGCLRQVVVTFVDITGEKKAEAERTKLQAKLAQASRLAAMGTLVAGMAHEINNPLAAVMSSAGTATEDVEELQRILRDGGSPDPDRLVRRAAEVREMLADVTSGAARIASMVKDLALFGSPDQQRRPIRIAETIQRSMGWLPGSVADRAQVRVEVAEVPDAMASEGQIEQVLVNLVVNAALAIPDGRRGEIVIRLIPGAPGLVRLEVSDDGKGISPHLMERISSPSSPLVPWARERGSDSPSATPSSRPTVEPSRSKAKSARARRSGWSCPPRLPRREATWVGGYVVSFRITLRSTSATARSRARNSTENSDSITAARSSARRASERLESTAMSLVRCMSGDESSLIRRCYAHRRCCRVLSCGQRQRGTRHQERNETGWRAARGPSHPGLLPRETSSCPCGAPRSMNFSATRG